jgi:SAM-dependent methyltransferase
MSAAPARFGFLGVDEFLCGWCEAQALRSAFDLKLIDFLERAQTATASELERELSCDARGMRLLLDLLAANNVVAEEEHLVRLTPRFLAALRYRDLLEAKLDFASEAAADVLQSFTALVKDQGEFAARSRIFELFSYQHSLSSTPENERRARAWMRFTTVLTRYESQACLAQHSFAAHRRMLDIGGNSGEFALQVCTAHPHLEAAVFDLPVICDLGQEHVQAHAAAGRITFHAGNALTDPLPVGFDLVTFKSMLHDWPDAQARRLLTHASQALAPGGTLLIFERGPLPRTAPPFGLLPMLPFFRSFREPEFYRRHLEAIGLQVEVTWVELDMRFFVVTGRLASRGA